MENQKENVRILMKFIIIGISGIGVNFIILYLSLLFFEVIIAVSIAIYISMTSNFLLNRVWTFSIKGNIIYQYLKYVLGSSIAGIIQLLVTILLNSFFIKLSFAYINLIFFKLDIIYIANLIGIGFGFIINFLISKYFVFQKD